MAGGVSRQIGGDDDTRARFAADNIILETETSQVSFCNYNYFF